MEVIERERQIHNWAATTLDGFAMMAKHQSQAAARTWIEACHRLGEHWNDDPVMAAALSNAAVGKVLLNDFSLARSAFCASDECWRSVAASINSHELPIAATSTSFHFRLAARYTASFTRLRRQRYAELCQAGWEIARFNSLQADVNLDAVVVATGSHVLRDRLAQTFGPSCVEAALLSEQRDDAGFARESLYEAKARTFSRIIEAARTPLDFWTRLECAVRLAALMIPSGAGASFSQIAHRG